MFSGRPDPMWAVPGRQARELVEAWSRLPPAAEAASGEGAALGYRGCALRSPRGRVWRSRGGVVVAEGPAESVGERRGGTVGERRGDVGGEWERRLLGTAPKGALPRGWGLEDRAG